MSFKVMLATFRGLKHNGKFLAFMVFGFAFLVSAWYYLSNKVYIYIVSYFWFGLIYGILQQWGRFCFASAWRDLIMFKVTRMFVGIMIAFMGLSIISAFLHTFGLHSYTPSPMGLHELIGGMLFGLGMVFAGGCATGTLYKTGEGNLTSLTVLFFLSFSQALFVAYFFDDIWNNFIQYQPRIFLPDYFYQFGQASYFISALLMGILLPLLLLGITYIVAGREREDEKLSLRGFCDMLIRSRRTSIAGLLIGVIAAVQVFVQKKLSDYLGFENFGEVLSGMGRFAEVSAQGTVFDPKYWYITTQEAQMGAWILEKFGLNMRENLFFGLANGIPELWHNPPLLLSLGIILGAMAMAFYSNEFNLKIPQRDQFIQAIIGGTFMGIGARIALGCNIGGFFTRAAFGNPGGWIFFIGMGVGAFFASKAVVWWTLRQMGALRDT